MTTLLLSLAVQLSRYLSTCLPGIIGFGPRYHVVREEEGMDGGSSSHHTLDIESIVEMQQAVLTLSAISATSPGRAEAFRRVLAALDSGRNLNGDDFQALMELDTLWGEERRVGGTRGLTPQEINNLPSHFFTPPSSTPAKGEGDGGVGGCAGASSSTAPPSCSICLDDYEAGEGVRTLPCFHSFHDTCVDKWLTQSGLCPQCRAFSGVGEEGGGEGEMDVWQTQGFAHIV